MRLQGLQYGVFVSVALMSALASAQPEEGNAAPDDGDPQNGLSSGAFRRNALTTNRKALEILSSHALDSALVSDPGSYIARQLHDSHAKAMMSEIVKCALDRQTTLTHVDPFDGQRTPWTGELGICQSWHERAPSEQCQQLVSACVMARVNGLGRSVPLWLRGYASELPGTGPVPTAKRLRESPPDKDPSEGVLIPSFGNECGPDRDCEWKARHVGKCQAGQSVGLRLDVPTTEGWEVRVCAGIHGCPAPPGPAIPGGWPSYSRRIGEFAQPPLGNASLLEVACPDDILAGGYYSVMMRKVAPLPNTLPDVRASAGAYPAPRRDVYPFLEGAFFGNLFIPGKLTRDCEVESQDQMTCRSPGDKRASDACSIRCGVTSCRHDAGAMPYTGMHACYSPAQQDDSQNGNLAVAYLNSRICDRPDASCFVERPGPCTGEGPDSAQCTWHTATGVFSGCSSPSNHSQAFPPITTYLNEPCDLIGEGKLCDKIRFAPPPEDSACRARLCYLAGVFLLIVIGVLLGCRRRLQRTADS